MVHGGILKHCRVVVTTIKVSLHDDDDEMMMVKKPLGENQIARRPQALPWKYTEYETFHGLCNNSA